MKSTQVYDLPTRLFHGLFALGFAGAFFIAKTLDDESPVYAYHMLLGLVLALLVFLRIVWGFIGTRYARFSSFALRPVDVAKYFRQLAGGKTDRTLGHNPASSWAALIMMALALGLAATGYLMTSGGDKEALEDVHELLANAFVLVVAAHVAGIVLHTLRHRDGIGLSMVHGAKAPVEGQEGIGSPRAGAALVLVAIVGAFVFHLYRNYDPANGTLDLFGTSLQLGESEDQGEEDDEHEHEHDDD